jgi:hypothetical protein
VASSRPPRTPRTFTLLGPDGAFYESATPGRLGGHSRQKVYGRLDCPNALSFLRRGFEPRFRVFFADEADAIAAGYRPCGACLRDEYRAWKASQPTQTNLKGSDPLMLL